MSDGLKIKFTDNLSKYLKTFPTRLFPFVKAAFKTATFDLQREMQKRTSGQPLKKRTGELSRSFVPFVGGTKLNNLFGQVSTRSKYARIHEEGGIIKPKNSKYLTIPLGDNKTAAGVTRTSARQLMSEGKSFFKKSKKSGSLILFTQDGSGIKPMFVLVNSVTIPARLGFIETAKKQFEKLMSNLKTIARFK